MRKSMEEKYLDAVKAQDVKKVTVIQNTQLSNLQNFLESLLPMLVILANDGNCLAQNDVGLYYNVFARNFPLAKQYYKLAAEQNLAVAQYNLYTLYKNHRNPNKAMYYCKLAADNGYLKAQWEMKLVCEFKESRGRGAWYTAEKWKYCKMAAAQGHPIAQAELNASSPYSTQPSYNPHHSPEPSAPPLY